MVDDPNNNQDPPPEEEEEEEEPPTHNGFVDPGQAQIDQWKQDQNRGVGSPATFEFLRGLGIPLVEMDNNNSNNPISAKHLENCVGDEIKRPAQIHSCRETVKQAYQDVLAEPKCTPDDDECVYGDSDYKCDFSGTMTLDTGAIKAAIESGSNSAVERTFIEVFDESLDFSGNYSGPLPSSSQLTSTTQSGGSYWIRYKDKMTAGGTETEYTTQITNVNASFIIEESGSPTFESGVSGQSGHVSGITDWDNCKQERKQVVSINFKKAVYSSDTQECPGLNTQSGNIFTPKIERQDASYTLTDDLYSNYTDCNQAFNEQAQKPDTSGAIPDSDRIDFDSYHNTLSATTNHINMLRDKYEEAVTNNDILADQCVSDEVYNVTNGDYSSLAQVRANLMWTERPWAADLQALFALVGIRVSGGNDRTPNSAWDKMKENNYPPNPPISNYAHLGDVDPTC